MSAPPGAVATLTRTTKTHASVGGFGDYVREVRAYSASIGERLSQTRARDVARAAYVRQYVDEPLELTGDLHCPHLDPVGEAVVNAMVRQGDMNRHAA